MLNNLLGKQSIMDVNYKGLSFKLDIKAKREIKRAREIFHEESLLEKLFENIQKIVGGKGKLISIAHDHVVVAP